MVKIVFVSILIFTTFMTYLNLKRNVISLSYGKMFSLELFIF